MAISLNLDSPILDASLNTSVSGTQTFTQCEGAACFTFARLIPGTVVTVVGDSGNVYGPATFVSFNNSSCAATLRETDPLTPGSTTTTVINCTKVESISFTS